MIHSIVPMEVIFQNNDSSYSEKTVEIQYMGELVEAVPIGEMSYTIKRIISTSPKAYLNSWLQPGKEIKLSVASAKESK